MQHPQPPDCRVLRPVGFEAAAFLNGILPDGTPFLERGTSPDHARRVISDSRVVLCDESVNISFPWADVLEALPGRRVSFLVVPLSQLPLGQGRRAGLRRCRISVPAETAGSWDACEISAVGPAALPRSGLWLLKGRGGDPLVRHIVEGGVTPRAVDDLAGLRVQLALQKGSPVVIQIEPTPVGDRRIGALVDVARQAGVPCSLIELRATRRAGGPQKNGGGEK